MDLDYEKEAIKKHLEWKGKIGTQVLVPLETVQDLSLAYTPGVSAPCLEIQKDIRKSFDYTRRGNTVAVITDGTAVLGLGDIGPEAGMPVMEGKCAIFKKFADVDAFPLCLKTKEVDEIVNIVHAISGSFGGINLEDISAPRCLEILEKLQNVCNIPVFHDDQWGTAIVTGSALINALKIVNKKIESVEIVINGAGAAGIAIGRFLLDLGAKHITMVDRFGILANGLPEMTNPAHIEIAKVTNLSGKTGNLADAMKGSDVFIGVSVGNIVSKEMVKSMREKAIVLALANPDPEISRKDALAAGAAVVGTGRSDDLNQVNNALIFPGIFRGALDARARSFNSEMYHAACYAVANLINSTELNPDYIIPSPFDKRVASAVAKATYEAAKKSGNCW